LCREQAADAAVCIELIELGGTTQCGVLQAASVHMQCGGSKTAALQALVSYVAASSMLLAGAAEEWPTPLPVEPWDATAVSRLCAAELPS
jgi:hypothetical protein